MGGRNAHKAFQNSNEGKKVLATSQQIHGETPQAININESLNNAFIIGKDQDKSMILSPSKYVLNSLGRINDISSIESSTNLLTVESRGGPD
jgi:hypothetical protein